MESPAAGELDRIDRLWLEFARRRLDDVRSGRVETIPGEEALREVREALLQAGKHEAGAAD
jgi:hypothetical protein